MHRITLLSVLCLAVAACGGDSSCVECSNPPSVLGAALDDGDGSPTQDPPPPTGNEMRPVRVTMTSNIATPITIRLEVIQNGAWVLQRDEAFDGPGTRDLGTVVEVPAMSYVVVRTLIYGTGAYDEQGMSVSGSGIACSTGASPSMFGATPHTACDVVPYY